MRKIKLFIACSIDGYIADVNGSLDWLRKYPLHSSSDFDYNIFVNKVDCVIMGGKCYRDILNMDFKYPYRDMISYIITRNSESETPLENVRFISDDIINHLLNLKNETGKDIWLVGGGETLSLLLEHSLVDELKIIYIPTILGDGVPLFPKITRTSDWQLIHSCILSSGALSVEYQKLMLV